MCELLLAIASAPALDAACTTRITSLPAPIPPEAQAALAAPFRELQGWRAAPGRVRSVLGATVWGGLFEPQRSWSAPAVVTAHAKGRPDVKAERVINCRVGDVFELFGVFATNLRCESGGPWTPFGDAGGTAGVDVFEDPAKEMDAVYIATAHRVWVRSFLPRKSDDAMDLHPLDTVMVDPPSVLRHDSTLRGLPGWSEPQEKSSTWFVPLDGAWCNNLDDQILCLQHGTGIVGGRSVVFTRGQPWSELRFGVLSTRHLTKPTAEALALDAFGQPEIMGPASTITCPARPRSTGDACRDLLALDGKVLGTVGKDGVVLSALGVQALFDREEDTISLEFKAGGFPIAVTALLSSLENADPVTAARRAATCELARAAHRLTQWGDFADAAYVLGDLFGITDHSQHYPLRFAAEEARLASLACSARLARGIDAPLARSWTGKRCGQQGIVLGGLCVEGVDWGASYSSEPIDARLPSALDRALTATKRRLADDGIALSGVGIIGCFLPRFETGVANRLRPGSSVRASNVSRHTDATACDLSRIVLDGTERKIATLTGALLASARGHARGRGDEGGLFRDPRFASEEPGLRVIRTLRNALVDEGFVVFTPLTNPSHHDHIHFHLARAPVNAGENPEPAISAEIGRASNWPQGRRPW